MNLRHILWWFRAYRGCGWSVRRALRAAWVMRRADPRALPELVVAAWIEGGNPE